MPLADCSFTLYWIKVFMCWGKGRIHENLGEMGANRAACLGHVMCLSAAYGGLFYKEKIFTALELIP